MKSEEFDTVYIYVLRTSNYNTRAKIPDTVSTGNIYFTTSGLYGCMDHEFMLNKQTPDATLHIKKSNKSIRYRKYNSCTLNKCIGYDESSNCYVAMTKSKTLRDFCASIIEEGESYNCHSPDIAI